MQIQYQNVLSTKINKKQMIFSLSTIYINQTEFEVFTDIICQVTDILYKIYPNQKDRNSLQGSLCKERTLAYSAVMICQH